jgi:hypothetical protein
MFVYANEADLLNVALFGITAEQWRGEHPDEKGNIRDFANLEQLVVLSNMECLADTSGTSAGRTIGATQPRCHYADEIAGG